MSKYSNYILRDGLLELQELIEDANRLRYPGDGYGHNATDTERHNALLAIGRVTRRTLKNFTTYSRKKAST